MASKKRYLLVYAGLLGWDDGHVVVCGVFATKDEAQAAKAQVPQQPDFDRHIPVDFYGGYKIFELPRTGEVGFTQALGYSVDDEI